MNNEYIALFEDIDETIDKKFHDIFIDIKIIGYVSLVMAGLPDLLGTKDVDALGVGVLEDQQSDIVGFLSTEFGKGSPAARRHGLYLDIVSKAIVLQMVHGAQQRKLKRKMLGVLTILRLSLI